jgi:outer membrane receptor protein involved in Fe transport
MNTGGFGVYAQDEWAVLPRLKLTLALRAEHNFNPTCDTNCFTLPHRSVYQLKLQGVDTPYNQALQTGARMRSAPSTASTWLRALDFTWSPRQRQQDRGQRRRWNFL